MMAKTRSQTSYHNFYTGARVYPYDWQMKLRKDDYFEIVSECIPTIYGQILEVSHKNGCFLARVFSIRCLLGEEGSFWIVEPTRILTLQEFEYARQKHWKVEEEIVELEA
jgi:hypothetical protein